MITIIEHPLIAQKLTAMRQVDTPPHLFRELLEELSLLMAFEVTRSIPTRLIEVETPLGRGRFPVADTTFAVIPILRAGLGMLNGILKLIPTARVGHIGMWRDEKTLQPVEYYCKLPPDLGRRTIIVVDPMLATGNSVSAAIKLVKARGGREIRYMSLLATPQGIDRVTRDHPDVHIFTAAVDPELDERGYIIPGLGDAGDRIFGTL
jgi:uracil phosphoribosyltransferase